MPNDTNYEDYIYTRDNGNEDGRHLFEVDIRIVFGSPQAKSVQYMVKLDIPQSTGLFYAIYGITACKLSLLVPLSKVSVWRICISSLADHLEETLLLHHLIDL